MDAAVVLIGLAVLFFVVYEAVYLAVRRALNETETVTVGEQKPPEPSGPPAERW